MHEIIETPQQTIEKFVTGWITQYRLKVEAAADLSEYFALVTSVGVFRDLIMIQFTKELEKDSSEEGSVDDILEAIGNHASMVAKQIDRRVALKTAN